MVVAVAAVAVPEVPAVYYTESGYLPGSGSFDLQRTNNPLLKLGRGKKCKQNH